MIYPDSLIRDVLERFSVVALVGASANPARASFGVGQFMAARGIRVIPVNPGLVGQSLFGEEVRASLADCPPEVETLDLFRRSEAVLEPVQEALEHLPNLQTVWMQLEVINLEAAALAEAAGKVVIMDRCPKIEFRRLNL